MTLLAKLQKIDSCGFVRSGLASLAAFSFPSKAHCIARNNLEKLSSCIHD